MTWVVVSDPVPGGATILGRGLGRDSRDRDAQREARRQRLAGVRGAQLRGVPQLLRVPAARQARRRIHACASTTRAGSRCRRRGSRRCTRRRASARRRTRRSRSRREARLLRVARCVARRSGSSRVVARLRGRARAADASPRSRRRIGRPTSRCSTATARRSRRVRVDKAVRRLAWVPLAEISPALLHGDRPERGPALLGAQRRRLAARRRRAPGATCWNTRTRGASTLTMQLAGLLDDGLARPGRRPQRRARSSARRVTATRLERSWKKSEILEAYLNSVPFRGEIVGIDALAQTLFGKHPSGLDAHEAAIAAALVRGPNARPAAVAAARLRRARAAAARLRRRRRR